MALLNNMKWIPPNQDAANRTTTIYTNFDEGYFTLFYYACLFLMGNDSYPTDNGELLMAIISVFVGTITVGILVGQFSSLINIVTRKERQ